jgi:hypothetical protein
MKLNPEELAVLSFQTTAHGVSGGITDPTVPITADPTVGARFCPPQTNQTC